MRPCAYGTAVFLVLLFASVPAVKRAVAVEALPKMCGVQQLGWSGLKEDKVRLDNGTLISFADGRLLVSSQGKTAAKYSPSARLYRDAEGAVHVIDGVDHTVVGTLKTGWPKIAEKRGIVMPNCLRTMLADMGVVLTKAGLQTTKDLEYSKPTEGQLKAVGCYAMR